MTVQEAIVNTTTGKMDKVALLNYAKTLDMVGVLELVKAGSLTPSEAGPLLNAPDKQKIKFKVSEKGALSVYGIQKQFPVTLYADQWERILAQAEDMKAFIKANATTLKRK